MNRSATAVRTLILIFLSFAALSQSTTLISRTPGIDFYQFWGVAAAERLSGHALGSPYRDGRRYVETLKAYAAVSGDARLKAASGFWGTPDFAGSPLLYTVFAVVPGDYTVAVTLFRVLQLVLFLAGLLLLGRRYRLDPFLLAGLALLCVLTYQPLISDVRVGNLGAVQLVFVAGLVALAEILLRRPSVAQRIGLATAFLAALALLTLCKPNVVVIAALLVGHLAVRLGVRAFLTAAVGALIPMALLVVLPCLYFGSWAVWGGWYSFVYGADPYMLVRPVASGNFSTPLLASTWLRLDVFAVATSLLVLLVIAFAARAIQAGAAPRRAPLRVAVAAARRLLGDADLALAIGVVLITATSPLYWLHYYVLLLIPSLWLLTAPGRAAYVPALAAAAIVMSSGTLEIVLRPLQWPDATAVTIALSWVPLAAAVLIHIGSPATEAGEAPAGAAEGRAGTGREATRPPGRRRKR